MATTFAQTLQRQAERALEVAGEVLRGAEAEIKRQLRDRRVGLGQQAFSLGAGLIQKTFRLPGLMGFGTQ